MELTMEQICDIDYIKKWAKDTIKERGMENIRVGDTFRGLVSNDLVKVVDIKLENYKFYIYLEEGNGERWHTTYSHFQHCLFEKVEV